MSKSKQNRNRKTNATAALACAVACSPAASPSSALLAAVAHVQASRYSEPAQAAETVVPVLPEVTVDETPNEAGERLYPNVAMYEQMVNADAGLVDDDGALRIPYNPVRDVACGICGVPYGEVG